VGSGIPEPRQRNVFDRLEERIKKDVKKAIIKNGIAKPFFRFFRALPR